jgi:RNA-splicing ligase RtcB
MIQMNGKYNRDCKIFIDEVEYEALALIQSILDDQVSENVSVRIMPDTHAGKGIVIGFTMPMTNLLNPNHIGVDIGCGMLSARFSGDYKLNLEEFDSDMRKRIPMGFNLHTSAKFKDIPFDEVQKAANTFAEKYNLKFGTSYSAPIYSDKWLIKKLKDIDMDVVKFYNSIGSMGAGNHMIEVGKSENTGDYWVTIHSGSRNFGLKIADFWVNVAKGKVTVASDEYNRKLDDIIQNTYPKSDIPKRMRALKDEYKVGINKEYLSGDNMLGYCFDMIFAQQYALWNRMTMLDIIKDILNVKFEEVVNTIHNYIDFNDFIIRKGAISAYKGQRLIIPLNMRDGVLLCEGKSNSDWNNSAPHGAGRLMSRTEARNTVDMDKFRKSMLGIYSTSVTRETLDESPMAYKNSEMIESLIQDTVIVLDHIRPVLNLKDTGAGESWKERKAAKKKRDKERELNMDAKRRMKRRG